PLLKASGLYAGGVELAIPGSSLVEGTIARQFQNVQSRSLVLPDLEVLREGGKGFCLIGAGHNHVAFGWRCICRADHEGVPRLCYAVVNGCVAYLHESFKIPADAAQQYARASVPSIGVKGLAVLCQRAVAAALPLNSDVVLEL